MTISILAASVNVESFYDNTDMTNDQRKNTETYVGTDKYKVNLFGKKVTVIAAAAAIVTVCPYASMAVATKIVISAIGGGVGASAAVFPNNIYIIDKKYRARSNGKTYARHKCTAYENSNYTGKLYSWTYSKRNGK